MVPAAQSGTLPAPRRLRTLGMVITASTYRVLRSAGFTICRQRGAGCRSEGNEATQISITICHCIARLCMCSA